MKFLLSLFKPKEWELEYDRLDKRYRVIRNGKYYYTGSYSFKDEWSINSASACIFVDRDSAMLCIKKLKEKYSGDRFIREKV